MSIVADIVDGPHGGKSYSMSYPPVRLYLPIWPEPDFTGPPYPYAVYERESDADPVRYKYVKTERD